MKEKIKNFILRGLLFSSGGPIIYGIIFLILDLSGVEVLSSGIDIFKGIITTFLLAFFSAGISIVWQNERLGLITQSFIHSITIYGCYLFTYLINNWIKKDSKTIIGFSIIFVLIYLVIWLVVYLFQKHTANKLNQKLK